MNTKFVRLVLVVLASLSLAGCFETLGRRPAGYTHQGGYLIPPGQSAEEQLAWVNQEEAVRCRPDARRLDIITGVVIGATAGAVIASRGSRATGAVLGGLGGGAIGTMSVGDYCSTLQRTRGLIQAHITAQQPVETYQCQQVFDTKTGKWVIPEGACQRNIQQQRTLDALPKYIPR